MSELRDQCLHKFGVGLLVYDASEALAVLAAHYPVSEQRFFEVLEFREDYKPLVVVVVVAHNVKL